MVTGFTGTFTGARFRGFRPGRPAAGRASSGTGVVRHGRVAAIAACGLAAALAAGCSGGGDAHRLPKVSHATALAPVAEELQQAVADVWPKAADIWPGVRFKDERILLGDGRNVRVISTGGVSRVGSADLARQGVTMPSTGSAFITWDRHPAVIMNAADPSYGTQARDSGVSLAHALFSAATDELFHAAQQNWPAGRDRKAIRGTEYPLAVTPRLYRAMLYDDLLAAYRRPRERGQRLAAAAYWLSRWEKEYPEEAGRARSTDITEGAANYFDAIAVARARGVDVDDPAELRKYVVLRKEDQNVGPAQLTVDGEGAALGGVSGLLLDEARRKGWKRQVAQGRQTPVGLLLNGVGPVTEQPSHRLRQAIQNVLAAQNSDLIPRLNPLVRSYHDDGHSLLLIPLDAADGDLDAGGYYTTHEVPYALLARVSGTFRLASGLLKVNEASVLAGAVGGNSYLIVPIDPDAAKSRLSANRIHLRTGTLDGTFQVKARAAKGRHEYVAQ